MPPQFCSQSVLLYSLKNQNTFMLSLPQENLKLGNEIQVSICNEGKVQDELAEDDNKTKTK